MTRRTLLTLLTLCLILMLAPLVYSVALTPAAPQPIESAGMAAPTLVEPAPLAEPAAFAVQPAISAADPEPEEEPAPRLASPAVSPRPDVDEPTIWISPEEGEADGTILVEGAGFPPNLLLAIYVGLPNAGYGPDAIVTFVSDAEGAFFLDFTMPATWPDGRPITQPQLIIITSTEDGRVKALAPLTYVVRLDGRGEAATP